MGGTKEAEGDGAKPAAQTVSWIEAALQAGLGGGTGVRPDLARDALRDARGEAAGEAGGSADLEAWLESIAIVLDAEAGESVRDAAEKIRANRAESLGAHARIAGDAVGDLVRRDP